MGTLRALFLTSVVGPVHIQCPEPAHDTALQPTYVMKWLSSLTLLTLASLPTLSSTTIQAGDVTVQAGHHVIWSWPGTTLPQELIDATTSGRVGGVIFYAENVNDQLPAQIQSLQDAYKKSNSYPGYPLLVVTDQEGGKVNRLPGGPAQSAKQIGASNDPVGAAALAAADVADVFSKYHTNGDLAPVVDVFREPGDFTDSSERSFSMDPATVGNCAASWVTELQSRGYIATAKHFPGLGAAGKDANTDLKPVTLDVSLADLRKIDEVPYQSAVKAGIKMIMPSWAIYPALDSENPSGLSKKWIQDELRGRLKFQGVTISDALEAGAIKSFGSTGELAVLASAAGIDIVLASVRQVSQGSEAVDAIAAAVQSGRLDRAMFEKSTQRIVALRKGLT